GNGNGRGGGDNNGRGRGADNGPGNDEGPEKEGPDDGADCDSGIGRLLGWLFGGGRGNAGCSDDD
ncbi:MAG: hypothetical protein MRY71_02265, partial [Algiphilus sp.]|nr:hypothetical protein [Algiphilus sp.]